MTRRQVLAEALKLTGVVALYASCYGGCGDSGNTGQAGPVYDPRGRRVDDSPEARDWNRGLRQREINRDAGR